MTETKPADGYATAESVDITIADTAEPQKVEMKDDMTKVDFSKQDLTTGKELPGAHLQVLDQENKLVEEWISTDTPHRIAKLVVGEEYTMVETKPADGYATAESVVFTIADTGDVQKVEMKDDVTKVDFSKQDLTTGKEITGAHLKVTDQNGNLVEAWISEETPHRVTKLVVGQKYTMTETKPADGYATAESVTFTVGDTVDVQKVEMKDDVTKVDFSKQDLTTGKELPGAHLKVTDKDGKVVDQWTSTKTPHRIERLVVGQKYTMTETKPADGYTKAESVTFTVADTADVQKVEMEDDVTKVEISTLSVGGKKISGASLSIIDEEGDVVATFTSTSKPYYIEKLPLGDYTLHLNSLPKGYIAETTSMKFKVKNSSEKLKLKMIVKAQQQSAKKTVSAKTGDDNDVLLWLLLSMMAAAGMAGSVYGLERRKERRN
jgi:uncharacterized surface anchored protein